MQLLFYVYYTPKSIGPYIKVDVGKEIESAYYYNH